MRKWLVYRHLFPNWKSYIGITWNTQKRFANGNGYSTQTKIKRAIDKYGWGNIQHEVLEYGLTQEEAKRKEMEYIELYDAYRNGYNATIGGDNIKTCYLDADILAMIRQSCRCGGYYLAQLAFDDRYDKTSADFWNEANRAIIIKHGKLSSTSSLDCDKYWYYMGCYYELYEIMQNGEDTSAWHEVAYEEAIYGYYFGKGSPQCT